MKPRLISILSLLAILALHIPASALIFLPENSLESLLVRCDSVVLAKAIETSESANTATVEVADTLKGQAAGKLPLTGLMLRVSSTVRHPRFAADDRIVLFLGPATGDTRPILYSQKLDTDAEVRTMKACIIEILTMAQTLADLGDIKKDLDEKAIRDALTKLAGSKNAYSQILLGRLMKTRLTERIKPTGSDDIIATALASTRKELLDGAITWAGQFESLPPKIRAALDHIAKTADPDTAKAAQALLAKP